jgi:phosphoglycolate phosphatase
MANKLVVFDLDGTLVDSASTVAEILNTMRIEIGRLPVPVGYFLPWISLGGDALVAHALEIPINIVGPHTKKFRDMYYELPTPSESIYSGAFEALEHLARRGLTLNICTNKPRRLAEKVLKETQLHQFFSFVCAGGDLPTNKPNPANLLACLSSKKNNFDDAYFVGDSSVDQLTSEKANVKFIFFESGYDDGVDKVKAYATFENYDRFIEVPI